MVTPQTAHISKAFYSIKQLGSKATDRSLIDSVTIRAVLREGSDSLHPHFEAEKGCLSPNNGFFWNVSHVKSEN